MAGAYQPRPLRLPGMSSMNMPRVSRGGKTGQVPSMRKFGKPPKT